MNAPLVGKFGKLPAGHDPQTVMLADLTHYYGLNGQRVAAGKYRRVEWGRPPFDVTTTGSLGNLRIGDCSIASKLHAIQLWTAWGEGPQAQFTDDDAITLYEKICGYVPGKNDPGGRVIDVLNYWMKHPEQFKGHELDGYVNVELGNLNDLKDAIWICGSVDCGLLLPKTCIEQGIWRYVTPFGDGTIGSAGGHNVNIIGYDDTTQLLDLETWGHLKQMSYVFWQYYADETRGLFSKNFLMKNGLTPSNFNWSQAIAFANVRN